MSENSRNSNSGLDDSLRQKQLVTVLERCRCSIDDSFPSNSLHLCGGIVCLHCFIGYISMSNKLSLCECINKIRCHNRNNETLLESELIYRLINDIEYILTIEHYDRSSND